VKPALCRTTFDWSSCGMSGATVSTPWSRSASRQNGCYWTIGSLVLVKAEEAPYYRPLFVMDHRGVAEFNTAGLRR
jgi:hypothetical protein